MYCVSQDVPPFREQRDRIVPVQEFVPRTGGLTVGRLDGAERRQVQRLRHLLELGREAGVVDVSVSVRVELVKQSFNLVFGYVKFSAHHGEVLVFDVARFVDIAR